MTEAQQIQARADAKRLEWYTNIRRNAQYVTRDYTEFVSRAPLDEDKKVAVVFGAGASLKQMERTVPDIARACHTMVSPTVLPWFVHHAGQQPTAIFNVDKHPKLAALAAEWSDNTTPLILSPAVHHRWIDVPGERYWFLNRARKDEPCYSQAITELFAIRDAETAEPLLTTMVDQLGCVTNEIVLLLYFAMGRTPITDIVLAGADYGYWGGYGRVPEDPEAEYPSFETQGGEAIQWGQWKTNKQMVMYKWQLMLVWRQFKFRLWRMGPSLMDEIPLAKRDQVIRGRFGKYPNEKHIELVTARAMQDHERRMGPVKKGIQ